MWCPVFISGLYFGPPRHWRWVFFVFLEGFCIVQMDMRSITVTSNVSGLLVNSPEMRQEVYFFHLAPPFTELWMPALCDVTKGHRTSQTLVTAPTQRQSVWPSVTSSWPLCFQGFFNIHLFSVHQRGAREHQVIPKDHVSSLQACLKNSIFLFYKSDNFIRRLIA